MGVVSLAGEEAGGGERWRPPVQPSHGLQRLCHSPRQTHGNLPKKVGELYQQLLKYPGPITYLI
jgi:hypothetical protein